MRKSNYYGIVCETPDLVCGKGWVEAGVSTFYYYWDKVVGRGVWVGVGYGEGATKLAGIISSDEEVREEVAYFFNKEGRGQVPVMNRIILRIMEVYGEDGRWREIFSQVVKDFDMMHYGGHGSFAFTHRELKFIVLDTFRGGDSCTILSGRLYELNDTGEVIFTVWQPREELKKNFKAVGEYLRASGYKAEGVRYQSKEMESTAHISYEELMGSTDNAEDSIANKKAAELAQRLHMEKGKLDKAVLRMIAGYKKLGKRGLIAAIEEEFNMPYLQVQRKLEAVGLTLGDLAKHVRKSSWH